MLRWMSLVKSKDRIWNDYVRDSIGVEQFLEISLENLTRSRSLSFFIK